MTAPAATIRVAIVATDGAAKPGLEVGRPFQLIIEVAHDEGLVAVLPAELKLGDEVEERSAVRAHERLRAEGRELDRYVLEVVPFAPGPQTIPALTLAVGDAEVTTSPLAIEVASSLDEQARAVASSSAAEAAPALEQLTASNPEPRLVEILDARFFGALGGVALLLLGLWLWRRWAKARRDRPAPVVPEPPPPPVEDVALARLRALLRAPRATAEEQKALFLDLSDIVRRYLGGRYAFDSVELTVAELMDALAERETPALDPAALRALLTLADLVKFAKATVDEAEATHAIESAIGLVRATTAALAPPVAPDASGARP